jgi:hypothetical protein
MGDLADDARDFEDRHGHDMFEVPDGYDRHKVRRQLTVRRLTDAEIYNLPQHIHRCKLICNDGQLRDVRMNGAIKRWKTMPDRISIPLKVGFRECFRFDLLDARRDLVILVDPEPPVHYCDQCKKDMGNEWILGPVCGKCCRANHKRVTGG